MDLPVFYGIPSFFDSLMAEGEPGFAAFASRHFPPLQIFEDERVLYIRACIPGVSLEDVALTLKGSTMLIEGSVPLPEGEWLRRERPSGPFKREISLPCDVDGDAVEAVMRDGLLTVSLPKTVRKDGKRVIPVEAAKGAEHG